MLIKQFKGLRPNFKAINPFLPSVIPPLNQINKPTNNQEVKLSILTKFPKLSKDQKLSFKNGKVKLMKNLNYLLHKLLTCSLLSKIVNLTEHHQKILTK